MRLRLWLVLLIVTGLTGLVAACATLPVRERGQFLTRTVEVEGTTHRYQVFVPSSRAGGRKPPVVLFLHGSGERGADGEKPTLVGVGPRIRTDMDGFPAIVVFPQAPENGEWPQVTPMVLAQLEAATREFGGDRDRTYLTGLSMGGFGVWDLALKEPGRFAALAPVCGGLVIPRRPTMNVTGLEGEADPYAAVAARVKDIPIWQFHGARDDLVPPDYSRRMDAALKAAGARDARSTEFPDANHNSWDPAYSQTPEFWTWLFAQRRAG